MQSNALMERIDEQTGEILQVQESNVVAVSRSEVEAQLDAAHKYPRSVSKAIKEACSLATLSTEIAEACIYTLPRDGKNVAGPSVRMAEIMMSCWGNMHVGARPFEVGETDVTSEGVAWDLEKNVRISVRAKRRIVNKNGRRYSDDMITMTENAAGSIALRNAIFRVIPKAYVQVVYDAARKVAVGDARTLADKRADVLGRLQKLGVSHERVLHALSKTGVDDIGLEDIEILIGLGTAVKNGERSIDDAFPAPPKDLPQSPEGDGRRMSLGTKRAKPANANAPTERRGVQIQDEKGQPIEIPREPAEDRGDVPDGFEDA